MISRIVLTCITMLFSAVYAQKVGVVLSGGGAAGIAHVGFLKALEENNIPIDYIAGTSIGALVGGMYAAGYSPEEMEVYFSSKEFINMASGKMPEDLNYFYKQVEENPAWIDVRLYTNGKWETSLPTNLISPVLLDYVMMENLSGAAAVANYQFDSLFVPFRCVAADIANKEQVVFKEGHLTKAIRASMSYPFYLKPITIDGKLLFDGGLYNNFPSDIMYQDFFPDIILGSNVAANVPPPQEDNVVSQIKSMLVSKTNYTVICENGVCVTPENDISTFDFDKAPQAIVDGYKATMAEMQEIKYLVNRRSNPDSIKINRNEFKKKQLPLEFDGVDIEGLNKRQASYFKGSIVRKNKPFNNYTLKKPYFRAFHDAHIKSIYPTATLNKATGKYDLNLNVKQEKDVQVSFGGVFSSKPINTGHLRVNYNHLGNVAVALYGQSYFGKLHGAGEIGARIDIPSILPFYVEPYYTLNRWDYFKSFATFFEDVRPSFLVQNEQFYGINLGFPFENHGRFYLGASRGELRDEYYLTQNFQNIDTVDVTYFDFSSFHINFEHNTLNRKQYPTKGSYFSLSTKFVEGDEFHVPGSTSTFNRNFSKVRDWAIFKMKFDRYYNDNAVVRFGTMFETQISTQPLFRNYTSSILIAPAFTPTPESKTIFLESFRAHIYAALGQRIVISIMENVDLRFEGYIFQPYQRILKKGDLTANLATPFDKRYTIASSAGVFNSPVGQLALSVNYYHNVPDVAVEEKTPISILFHFGYIIHNKRALN